MEALANFFIPTNLPKMVVLLQQVKRQAKKNVLLQVLKYICDLNDDSELLNACEHDDISPMESLISLTVSEVKDLTLLPMGPPRLARVSMYWSLLVEPCYSREVLMETKSSMTEVMSCKKILICSG